MPTTTPGTITVHDLIRLLSTLPQTAHVILSADAEGNSFHPLEGVDPDAIYKLNDRGQVEIGIRDMTDDLRELGLTDDDVMSDGLECVVLYPLH